MKVRSSWLAVPCALVGFALTFVLTSAGAARAEAQAPDITTQPALYPAFDPAVPDYVLRCANNVAVIVDVSSPSGTTVDVDGQGPRAGTFTTRVLLQAGQAFGITVASGSASSFHQVRCLPPDLPRWTFHRFGQSQVEWFTAAPLARTDFQPPPAGVSLNYSMIFDRNGVPVWWKKAAETQTDFLVLPNGNFGWLRGGDAGGQERRLDGSLVRTIRPPGVNIDPHEFMLLPSGNYLITTYRTITASYCGGTNTPILDNGVQEVTPQNAVVWTWWASNHIPLSEVPPMWCSAADANGVLDPYHINAVEPEGNDVLLSFRHLNADYSVHKSDGTVEWKIGGSTRAESLTVLNDPIFASGGGFLGQHDVRLLADGSITLHDNGFGTTTTRQPRAVRYVLDLNARTATLVEQKNDPSTTPIAVCCGSARNLSGGNWLMAWGSAGIITELSPSGSRVFDLTWDDSLFSYRSHPVPFGFVSRTALRAGMDAQFPRSYVRPLSASSARFYLVPAFKPCVKPDRTHGPPLAYPSCSSPAQASNFVTVGPNSAAFVKYHALVGNPSTPANEADVNLRVSISDVRWQSNMADYDGELQLQGSIRITDRVNGPLQNEPATGLDTELPVTVGCDSTASAAIGASCLIDTTLNALIPGTVVEGKRTMWELGQVQVYDGGSSGVAGSSGATLFETQGLFVP